MRLVKTLEVSNELGEGVIWDHQAQLLRWTDIQGSQLYSYSFDNDQLIQVRTPERLACFAPRDNGQGLVAAFESGFAFYNPSTNPSTNDIEWIKRLEQDNAGTRFNDGRTDRQGRLWAGTMVEDADKAPYKGSLYCLHNDLGITKTISGLSIPNSLCWSPDGNTLYHTDTPTQQINAYAFSQETATVGSASIFANTDEGCYPDGSIIDAQGYLWNAQWGGSKVVRYAPTGKPDLEINVPTQQPSCVAFAGKDLNLLCVTSAWQGMDTEARQKDKNAGHLFIYDTEFSGIAESGFIEH